MREQGLYESFETIDQFESTLYHNLDIKIDELLAEWNTKAPSTPQPTISVHRIFLTARCFKLIYFDYNTRPTNGHRVGP